eukprot:TRINITY_DN276_c0_g1_i1.p1 TRINITY_DN276_c0_g1~~TRINITY_DN276_c0_g1_i1.p1  ORF type:complete len:2464 (-),score=305.43 TRINITY_DN276_c0_g1_i1:82-7473(-)
MQIQGHELYVCDVPGNWDTDGQVADIVNAIAIAQALRSAASVRLVFLVDKASMEVTRGGNFTKFLTLIDDLISLQEHHSSVCILYNKYKPIEDSHVDDLVYALESIVEADLLKPELKAFVEKHIEELVDSRIDLLVDPLARQNRSRVVDRIVALRPITGSTTFRLPLLPENKVYLLRLCETLRAEVLTHLNTLTLSAHTTKLIDSIHLLGSESGLEDVIAVYTQVKDTIKAKISSIELQARQSFQNGHFEHVAEQIETLQTIERLLVVHADAPIEGKESLLAMIHDQVRSRLASIRHETRSFAHLHPILSWLHDAQQHLASFLVDDLKPYSAALEHILECVAKIVERIDVGFKELELGRLASTAHTDLSYELVQTSTSPAAGLSQSSALTANTSQPYDDLVDNFDQLSEINSLAAHFPRLQQFNQAKKHLDSIVRHLCQVFTAALTSEADIASQASLFNDTYAIAQALKASRLSLYMDDDLLEQLRRLPAALEKACTDRIQIIQQRVGLHQFDVQIYFAQLQVLLQVDNKLGADIQVDSYHRMLIALEDKVVMLGNFAIKNLQRTFGSSLPEQKSRFDDNMNALKELHSAVALDRFLSQPRCAHVFQDAIDKIDDHIKLIREKLFNGQSDDNKLDLLKTLEACADRLSVVAPARIFCASASELQSDITRLVALETYRLLSLNLQSMPSDIPEFGQHVRQLKRLVNCLSILDSESFKTPVDAERDQTLGDLDHRRDEAARTLERWLQWIEESQSQTQAAIPDDIRRIQQSVAKADYAVEDVMYHLKQALDSLLGLKQLEELAPQAAVIYDDAIAQVRRQQENLVHDAQSSTHNQQLAAAECIIKILRAMSIFQHHLPAADTASLSSALVAKRENITNEIPKLLERKNYALIAATLQALDKQSIEYRHSCEAIRDHFYSLIESKRVQGRARNLESLMKGIEQTCQLRDHLRQAVSLEVYDIPIEEGIKVADRQWLRQQTECKQLFDYSVRNGNYTNVGDLCDSLSGLTGTEDLCNNLNQMWLEHLKRLPEKFQDSIEKNNIQSINRVLNGLAALEDHFTSPGSEVLEAHESVKAIWDTFVSTQLQNIEFLVGLHKTVDANAAIHKLSMFSDVEAMTDPTKSKLRSHADAVNSLEQSMRKVSIDDSAQLSSLLFNLSKSPQLIQELLGRVDKVHSEALERAAEFSQILSRTLTDKSVARCSKILHSLLVLSRPWKGTEHETPVPALEQLYSRINDIRDLCQSDLDQHLTSLLNAMKRFKIQKKWIEVQGMLEQLEAAKNCMGDLLPENIRDLISKARLELHDLASTLASSQQHFEAIDFTLPVSAATIGDISRKLTQIKTDADVISPTDDETISYDSAINIIETKLRDSNRASGPTIDWKQTVVVVGNCYRIIEAMRVHPKLTNVAEDIRRTLQNRITQTLKDLSSAAMASLRSKKLEDLELQMLDIKNIEDTLQPVPQVLVEKHYQKLVAELEKIISERSLTIKKASMIEPKSLSRELVSMYAITDQLSCAALHAHVHKEIAGILNLAGDRSLDFYQLSRELNELGTLGRELVEDANYTQFRAFWTELMNKKTSCMTCDDALKVMKVDSNNTTLDSGKLEALYEQFKSEFDKYLQVCLLSDEVTGLVADIQSVRGSCSSPISIDRIRDRIPKLLAGIFALWSVLGSRSHYQQTGKMECVMKPHPIQVLAVFRLLGLDLTTSVLDSLFNAIGLSKSQHSLLNHVVQVGTGEGKSVILGSLSALLAFLGYDVYCACYSKYLSQRDYRSFQSLFAALGVTENISYATLSELADTLFNAEVDVRQATHSFLYGQPYNPKKAPNRPRILLFDEVDVFFDKEFYGATYNPSTYIRDPCVNQVMEYIWKNRNNRSALSQVYSQKPYVDLYGRFSGLTQIIRNSVETMLVDVHGFAKPAYAITTDASGKKVIGYNEFGVLLTNVTYGYKTAFAYLCEAEKNVVEAKTASDFLGLKINCGQFSYAELPFYFPTGILGVTGTLLTLGKTEKNILEQTYKVRYRTIMPSIYGPTKLQFRKISDVDIVDEQVRFHQTISTDALAATEAGRAVLVFFENEKSLKAFATSAYGKTLTPINFSDNLDNLDYYIKKATRTKQASLLPAVYGRGVDFLCVDNQVDTAGGIAVIMTYLPEDQSDEVQIRGRTARQGNKGSFKVVLHTPSLVKKYGIDMEELNKQREGDTLYDFLNQKRVAYFDSRAEERTGVIDRSKALHQEAMEYLNAYRRNRKSSQQQLQTYLLRQNPCRKVATRIVCISDATGSMSSVWAKAKVQITEMINRIDAIGGAGQVQLKWVAYRDYDCKDKVVEASGWETDPAQLIAFLDTIQCYGGGDGPEAVELGLKAANDTPERTRVVLIGDAEPHLEGKGNVVAFHKHTLETDYLAESEKLKASGVPVYSFYMNNNTTLVDTFTRISTITGGKAALFSNANTLIDVIAETALHALGGDDLVQEYRKTYHA